jgi:hypothetical protein
MAGWADPVAVDSSARWVLEEPLSRPPPQFVPENDRVSPSPGTPAFGIPASTPPTTPGVTQSAACVTPTGMQFLGYLPDGRPVFAPPGNPRAPNAPVLAPGPVRGPPGPQLSPQAFQQAEATTPISGHPVPLRVGVASPSVSVGVRAASTPSTQPVRVTVGSVPTPTVQVGVDARTPLSVRVGGGTPVSTSAVAAMPLSQKPAELNNHTSPPSLSPANAHSSATSPVAFGHKSGAPSAGASPSAGSATHRTVKVGALPSPSVRIGVDKKPLPTINVPSIAATDAAAAEADAWAKFASESVPAVNPSLSVPSSRRQHNSQTDSSVPPGS